MNEERLLFDSVIFQVAPRLVIEDCDIVAIPCSKIIGANTFNLTSSNKMRFIQVFPAPIAIKTSDARYELLPPAAIWEPRINGTSASHIICTLLPQTLKQEIIMIIKDLIFTIYSNHTFIKRREIWDKCKYNNHTKEAFERAFGYPPNMQALRKILGQNFYAKSPERTISTKNSKLDKVISKNHENFYLAEQIWDRFAKDRDIPKFRDLILNAPDSQGDVHKLL